MPDRFQIDRFAVENYRSIRHCDVELTPVTFFVGANGSGKTSFVDALLFVGSAVRDSLEKAIRDRSGVQAILHHPVRVSARSRFTLDISSAAGVTWKYDLSLSPGESGRMIVVREECRVETAQGERPYYLVEEGEVTGSAAIFPAVSTDRVYLANASGLPEFRSIFDFIAGIVSADIATPDLYFALQQLHLLTRRFDPAHEPRGLPGRFRNLGLNQPYQLDIIHEYLRAIAPPFDRIEVIEVQGLPWLRIIEKFPSGAPISFELSQASAGLVNSAGVLLELFEFPEGGKPASPVVIEEPEAFLHPGAIHTIRDSFLEASRIRQVIVTTHSPELLDSSEIPEEWIRSVTRDEAGTHIEALNSGTRSVIHDKLYTAGQLLRQGGLVSAPS